MTYISVINKQEYHHQTLEDAATHVYNKVKRLAEAGDYQFKFDVYYLTDDKTYRDLNDFEMRSFNKLTKQLWEANATEEQKRQFQELNDKEPKDLN